MYTPGQIQQKYIQLAETCLILFDLSESCLNLLHLSETCLILLHLSETCLILLHLSETCLILPMIPPKIISDKSIINLNDNTRTKQHSHKQLVTYVINLKSIIHLFILLDSVNLSLGLIWFL